MNKKIIIGSAGAILIIIGVLILVFVNNSSSKCNDNALVFKKEYEKYNNKEMKKDNKKYKLTKLSISENNPMKKLTKKEIIDKLNSMTGVVFFTSPLDFVSREMIPTILEVSKSFDCEVIYYYDIDEISSASMKNEILNVLRKKDEKLEEAKNSTILFIQKGEIKEIQIGIPENYEYGKKINDTQKKTLNRVLKNGFNSINNNMCEKAKQC